MRHLLLFLVLAFSFTSWAEFTRIEGLTEADCRFVVVHPLDNNILYLASSDSLYKLENREWRFIYKVKEGGINFVYPDPLDYELLYIATDAGLLSARDSNRVDYLFRSQGKDIKCLSFKREDNKLLLGTSSGLYIGEDGIYDFKKVAALPNDIEVYWIDYMKPYLYLATDMGLYKSEDFNRFQRTFITPRKDKSIEEEEEVEEGLSYVPRVVTVSAKDPSVVYLGTTAGLFISSDYGSGFKKAYIQGLGSVKINSILQDDNSGDLIYLGTDRGFFKVYLGRKKAIKVYEGLPTESINMLTMDKKGKLYLATALGLFEEGEDSREFLELSYENVFSFEPSAREVQQATLDYNEVNPEKIKAWRRSLRYRALLPQLDLGYDKTIYGTYSSGGQSYVGPRDWSVDLTWDLEDLIWNHYQDDIDTRSRLNTQLRLDILDEVNRLYFERKRVKIDLINNPPEESIDRIKRMMYLEELTAALDAYTGGFFSKRIEELKKKK
ncbi:MAG: hypothetical protein P9L98_02905 [Candidatus Kaelpia imicola]|nr:hypothetical protein [Candidatus Kaelpia imicola]